MKKNKNFIGILLVFFSMASVYVQAFESELLQENEFVFAVFASNRTRAGLLEKAQEQNILAYNINAKSTIDLENNCVRNVYMRHNNGWASVAEVPLPDVVYDFGVNKGNAANKRIASAQKELLVSRNIPFINPDNNMDAVNDKLKFAKLMKKNNISHPETMDFKKENLKKMLSRHNTLFIKPTMGSKGHGIIVVQKIKGTLPQKFNIKYKKLHWGKWTPVVIKSVKKKHVFKALNAARKKLKKSRGSFIIQQGIDFLKHDGEQTDIRVNVQRNKDNELVVTGMFMRVGGNLAQGGRPSSLEDVVKANQFSNQKFLVLEDRIKNLALRTHRAVEEYTESEIGDLGMDIVFKNEDNLFIIEANHKNGYPHMYVKKNPQIERYFGLPPVLDYVTQVDDDHELVILEYADFLTKNTQAQKPKS